MELPFSAQQYFQELKCKMIKAWMRVLVVWARMKGQIFEMLCRMEQQHLKMGRRGGHGACAESKTVPE